MSRPKLSLVKRKLPRCADCRRERELVIYGAERVCRECANKRDASDREIPWGDQKEAWK